MASRSTRPRSTSIATEQGSASAARLTHAIATTSRGTPGSRDPKIERCRIPTNSPPTRPWLFQSTPGSYQFAVAIQKEYQQNFLTPVPTPEDVAECFLRILRVEIEDPEESLTEVVPDSDYRSTFLKLTRNLAPDGESCSRLDVQTVGDSLPISLGLDVRQDLGRVIRKTRQGNETPDSQTESLHGLLRAVDLDNDWLELAVDNERVRVIAVSEEVDDVIGPLVNRPVIVRVSLVGGKRKFLDIEPESPRR